MDIRPKVANALGTRGLSEAASRGRVTPYTSLALLAELSSTLSRPKLARPVMRSPHLHAVAAVPFVQRAARRGSPAFTSRRRESAWRSFR